ncbi:competence type IV pilus minor pilin ComGF [Bacillus sp. SL00103]
MNKVLRLSRLCGNCGYFCSFLLAVYCSFQQLRKLILFEEMNRFSLMEWKQTVLQLDEELSRATAIRSVQGGKALEYVSDQGRVVTIEPYQEMLRKRMDQAGHLPLLQKVKECRVRTNQHRAILKVTDESGKVYEAVFFIYKGGGSYIVKREEDLSICMYWLQFYFFS